MNDNEEIKKFFYTNLFKKCSPKITETIKFEDCCKEGAENALTKIESFNKIIKETDNRLEEAIDDVRR